MEEPDCVGPQLRCTWDAIVAVSSRPTGSYSNPLRSNDAAMRPSPRGLRNGEDAMDIGNALPADAWLWRPRVVTGVVIPLIYGASHAP